MLWPVIVIALGVSLLILPWPRSEFIDSMKPKLREASAAETEEERLARVEQVYLENVVPAIEERPVVLVLFVYGQMLGVVLLVAGCAWLAWTLAT